METNNSNKFRPETTLNGPKEVVVICGATGPVSKARWFLNKHLKDIPMAEKRQVRVEFYDSIGKELNTIKEYKKSQGNKRKSLYKKYIPLCSSVVTLQNRRTVHNWLKSANIKYLLIHFDPEHEWNELGEIDMKIEELIGVMKNQFGIETSVFSLNTYKDLTTLFGLPIRFVL